MADQVRLDKVGDLITALTTEHVTAFMSADGESGHATVMKIIEAMLDYVGRPITLARPDPSWDASGGSFPASATAGNLYIVTVSGTVDGVSFAVNDQLLCLDDDASTSTYAGNWLKLDYTDQVLSVAGLTGAISRTALEAALTGLMSKSGGQFGGGVNWGRVSALRDDLSKHISLYDGTFGFNTNGNSLWIHSWHDFTFVTHIDGATQAGYIGVDGMVLPGATGDAPGTGKVNAVDYQINGESVADKLDARAKLADLASTDEGKGAAMVGVEAISGVTGETVQAVLEALAAAISANSGLGVGQTWANVTASRAINTAYQNTTGKPIMVAISAGSSGSAGSFYLSDDGSSWTAMATIGGNSYRQMSLIVLADQYYKCDASGINLWSELS